MRRTLRGQAFFWALGFFRFDSESQPTHLPLTPPLGGSLHSINHA